MLNRLFILSFVCFIFSMTFLSYAHSQSLPPDQEFDLLCSEVLMGLLSDINGRSILKGQKPLPDRPLDMNLSFMWWESSEIFQWSQREGRPLWDEKNPNWKDKDGNVMTYGQKYEERTVLPDMTRLKNLTPLEIYVLIEKEPLGDISIPERILVLIKLPSLTWLPDTPWIPSPIKLPPNIVWNHKEKEPLRWDVLGSAVTFGIGYLLSKRIETKKYFKDEDWKPLAPRCWTACALGEPPYNRPKFPEEKMTPEEWWQSELPMWYVTPRIYERRIIGLGPIELPPGTSDVLMYGSITYAAIVVPWKLFHKKDKFFE